MTAGEGGIVIRVRVPTRLRGGGRSVGRMLVRDAVGDDGRGAEAALTVVERATGIAVAKRLRVAGATSPGDVEQVARRIADARIREMSAKEEDLAGRAGISTGAPAR